MTQSLRVNSSKLVLASWLAIGEAIASSGKYALAQPAPIPDNTLGNENSVVTPNVNINGIPSDRIDGGAIRGINLFHSFREFNIDEGRGAYFTNPAGIENILSRVTGGNPSEILGKLGVLGNANLFLINPNGILFGQNASLDVAGSFVASTASSLKFADGTEFSATAPQTTPLLTLSVPIGLQFGGNAGSIRVQGNGQGLRKSDAPVIDTTFGLRVQPNKTLALVGGDIALDGATLKTAGGRIELGSVAGSGLVSLSSIDKGFALGYSGVSNFGNIQLSGRAAVDASGAAGGDIQVQGKRVTLQDGSQIEASTLESGIGGTLTVSASESVELRGTSADGTFSSGLWTQAYPGSTGVAGNLRIATGKLIVRDGARVTSTTRGQGRGGNIDVTASDSIEVIGTGNSSIGIYPSTLSATVDSKATGSGGNLTMETSRLIVRDGGQIQSGTFSTGSAGTLSVSAADSVELSGRAANGRPSGLFAGSAGAGSAGDLTIQTSKLQVLDGAQVNVGAVQGQAGNMTIKADSIHLENGGKLTAFTYAGNGGNITLQDLDLLLLRRGGEISTTAGTANAGGDGGDININAPDGLLVAVPGEDSDITANAFTGKGGNIQINASGILGTQFRQEQTPESDITASSQFGINGTVEINTPDVDPSRELVQLPVETIEPKLAQGCQASVAQDQSQFIITGRSGLPASPLEPLTGGDAVLADWITLNPESETRATPNLSKNPSDPTPETIVEATGWIINAKGDVILTANKPNVTPHNSWSPATSCTAPHASS